MTWGWVQRNRPHRKPVAFIRRIPREWDADPGCGSRHRAAVRHHGAVLLDLTLALVVAGLLQGIGIPALRDPLDRLAVERAALDIAGAHTRARIAAVTHNTVTRLVVRSDSLLITVGRAPDTTRLWSAPGPAIASVALSGPGYALTFQPAGISFGFSNGSFDLSRGSARRSVIVSRLGRVRIIRR